MNNQRIRALWFDNMRQRNLSERTIESYRGTLRKFEAALRGQSFLKVTEKDFVQAVKNWEPRLKASSLNTHLTCLKALYHFLYDQGHLVKDIRHLIPKKAKLRPLLKKVLSIPHTRKLILHPDINTKRGYRDRCMILLQYAGALRSMELLGLEVSDVNEVRQTIVVLRKGGDTQEVPVGSLAMQYLTDYMSHVRPLFKPTDDHLFCNDQGGPMTTNVYRKFLNRHMEAVGLFGYSSHDLRHAASTHMVKAGASIEAVQFFLGHKHIQSTEIYVRADQGPVRKVIDSIDLEGEGEGPGL